MRQQREVIFCCRRALHRGRQGRSKDSRKLSWEATEKSIPQGEHEERMLAEIRNWEEELCGQRKAWRQSSRSRDQQELRKDKWMVMDIVVKCDLFAFVEDIPSSLLTHHLPWILISRVTAENFFSRIRLVMWT